MTHDEIVSVVARAGRLLPSAVATQAPRNCLTLALAPLYEGSGMESP